MSYNNIYRFLNKSSNDLFNNLNNSLSELILVNKIKLKTNKFLLKELQSIGLNIKLDPIHGETCISLILPNDMKKQEIVVKRID